MTDLALATRDVRAALADPVVLVTKLGLHEGAKRQARGMVIRCPAHGERNASCSVTRGPDGTARIRCFACDFSADAIGLVAKVYGLSTRGSDYAETLAVAAELAGLHGLAGELRGGEAPKQRERPPAPEPQPEPDYPPPDEVARVWDEAQSVADDRASSYHLVSRRIDPEAVACANLARALRDDQELPAWAWRRGKPWTRSGHRMLVRVWNARGQLVSLRAWRVEGEDEAKRVPPAGHRSSGLVLADRTGRGMLLGRRQPSRVVIVEGEPDFLVHSLLADQTTAVIGVGSGWWTPAHAERIPRGSEVVIRTHADEQGERYAEQVAATIADRCPVWRAA